ncbi:LysR family transcriptional regulator [Neisseria leonii]|uniref:LysR family transcriptional regulator n=1 Tax=Neisseria leonii TaxID=2995413 RepID=A0A9X4IDV5_9NEIS|nr:LysR family transcriptional regulator [Neisseria sp. 51.81]MDD9328091.1 LysR family transcriptional regulator [Neisseria sp. 51.81]
MDLKQLKYFIHVAQLGSYTRAADLLEVAQPVLSRQIRLLETELRQNLLIRHGRGVLLTESGQIMLEHCLAVMARIDRIYEDLSTVSGKLSGHVLLGMPPTMAKLLSVPLIKTFSRQLPDARISISEGLTTQLQNKLQQGHLDMALLYNPPYCAGIDTTLLHEEPFSLIAPLDSSLPGHNRPLDVQQLALLPLITPSAPNTFRLLIEQELRRHNLTPSILWEINSIETALQLVAEGMGYTVLPAQAARLLHRREKLRAIPIESSGFTSRLYLAVSGKRALSRTQKETGKLLTRICTDYLQQENG